MHIHWKSILVQLVPPERLSATCEHLKKTTNKNTDMDNINSR